MGLLSRLGLALGLGLAVVLTWGQLVRHVSWQDHTALADALGRGALTPPEEMLARIAPLLDHAGSWPCAVLEDGTLVTLHLQASAAQARSMGMGPFQPGDAPDLAATRRAAAAVIDQALACRPMNGGMWLNRAAIAHALDAPPAQIAQYLSLSERYAPYERAILRRRAQLF